jgi:membrane protein YdbS with pleckstrin-like domain
MEQNQQQNPQEPKLSDIAEKAAERRKPLFDPTGRIEALTASETLVADIRRHPFGLFLIYLQTFVAFGLALVLIFTLMPSVIQALGLHGPTVNAIASIFGLLVVVFALIFVVLATRIYKYNQLIVSDKNVTQVLQIGLFSRKVSELSMANVEDVTAEQHGIFPTIFNYGTLKIETAGEQNNFVFIYCPNPNAYAKAILDARLQFITEEGSEH